MIEAAVAAARRGEVVVVVAAHHEQAQQLVVRVRRLAPDAKNTPPNRFYITVAPGAVIVEVLAVLTDSEVMNLDIRNYPNKPVYWDHFALETKCGRVIAELHRWDAEVEGGPAFRGVSERLKAAERLIRAQVDYMRMQRLGVEEEKVMVEHEEANAAYYTQEYEYRKGRPV